MHEDVPPVHRAPPRTTPLVPTPDRKATYPLDKEPIRLLGAFGFGVPIDASWPDADFNHTGAEPTSDQWRRHWTRCCRGRDRGGGMRAAKRQTSGALDA
jgi:hypothetical protein